MGNNRALHCAPRDETCDGVAKLTFGRQSSYKWLVILKALCCMSQSEMQLEIISYAQAGEIRGYTEVEIEVSGSYRGY